MCVSMLTFESLFEFMFRFEPFAQSHSLRAVVRYINGMGALADLFQSGRRLERLNGGGALIGFGRFMC